MHKELKANKVTLVLKELKELKDNKVILVHKELKEQEVILELREP